MSEKPLKDTGICERCGKEPASVHLRRVSEGEETELHLCAACAEEEGLESPPASLGGDPVSLLFQSMNATEGGDGVCPGCGLTYSGFRETGRLGCARCYKTFSEELGPLIRRIQGASRHVGKRPQREGEQYEQAARLRRLVEELERAVGSEDYERAAELRDRIKELETHSGTEGNRR